MLRKVSSIFAVIIIALLCTIGGRGIAEAATLHKDLPSGAPPQGIVFDAGKTFINTRPTLTQIGTSNYKIINNHTPWAGGFSDNFSVIYDAYDADGILPGSFSLRWPSIATDQAGDKVDIVLTVGNINEHGSCTRPAPISTWQGQPYATGCVGPGGSGIEYTTMDISYHFYKAGTSKAATGNFATYFVDLDTYGNGIPEGIRLLSNYENDIHVVPDDYTSPGAEYGPGWYCSHNADYTFIYTNTNYIGDADSLNSGFMITAKNGFKMSWQGTGGVGTGLLMGYANRKITATTGSGGSISSPGTTVVGWKNNKTYTMTPKPGYTVKDVTVDGVSVGKRTTYTFSTVITNHTIHVEWQPLNIIAVQKSSADTSLSVTNRYSLQGAQYTLYTDAGCTTLAKDANGSNIVLTTDANGRATTQRVIYDGTYYLKETKASTGFRLDTTAHKISISGGTTHTVSSSEPPKRGYIDITKISTAKSLTDNNNCYTLKDAVYGIYRDGVEVTRVSTKADGTTSTFVAPLGKYTVKELSPSEGYRLDETEYSVDITVDEQHQRFESRETPLIDIYPMKLHKKDADAHNTNHPDTAQGGLTLDGAVYRISYYDGYYTSVLETAPLNSKWQKTYTTATDDRGESVFVVPDADKFTDGNGKVGWPLGTYVIEEIKAPFGYYPDKNAPYITQITKATSSTGENNIVVGTSDGKNGTLIAPNNALLSLEEVMRSDLALMKFGEPTTDPDQNPDKKVPQAGVKFDIINNNDCDVYRIDAKTWAKPGEVVYSIVTNDDGWASTESIASANGYAHALACGRYIVHEDPSTTHEGYTPMKDRELTVTTPENVYHWIIENKTGTPIKIVKCDESTGKAVRGFAKFQIFDEHGNIVEMKQEYPSGAVMSTYTTDINGFVVLPDKLMPGTYTIREVQAPDGYTLSNREVSFEVTRATVSTWDTPFEVKYANEPVKGIITVNNIDDETTKKITASSSKINIYAAEDIVTPDGTVRAVKGELVYEGTTVGGSFDTPELFLGSYEVVQQTAPDGYIFNTETYSVVLNYENDSTPIVHKSVDVPNKSQKGKLQIEIDDRESSLPITRDNTVFEVRAAEDVITPDGTVRYRQGEVIETITTDEHGIAVTESDHYIGKYEFVEVEAADGYVIDRTPIPSTIEYAGPMEDTATSELVHHSNIPQKGHVVIEKLDAETYKPVLVKGATFEIYADEDIITGDNVIHLHAGEKAATATTDDKGIAVTKDALYLGSYRIREVSAPNGYMRSAADTSAVLSYAGQDTELTESACSGVFIANPPAKGKVVVTKRDSETHNPLLVENIEIDIVAKEDIVGGDGTIRYHAGEVVTHLFTNSLGQAEGDGLYIGKYLAVEKTAPSGYKINTNPEPFDITYINDEEQPNTVEVIIEDDPIKGTIEIVKQDSESKQPLVHDGADFKIIAKNDIITADGTIRHKTGEEVAQLSTREGGKGVAENLYPGTYTIKEVKAPSGYLLSETDIEVVLEGVIDEAHGSAWATRAFGDVVQKSTITITKIDKETGGAIVSSPSVLKVIAAEDIITPDGEIKYRKGDEVDTVSTDESGKATTKELYIGKYSIIEQTPPDHYLLNNIPLFVETKYDDQIQGNTNFTVEHEGMMPRGTVSIEKIDENDHEILISDAKFDLIAAEDIVSGDGTVHFREGEVISSMTTDSNGQGKIEFLRQGNYMLVETEAPAGYLLADAVDIGIWYSYAEKELPDDNKPEEANANEKTDVVEHDANADAGTSADTDSDQAESDSNQEDIEIDIIEVRHTIYDMPIQLNVAKTDESGEMLSGCGLSVHSYDDTANGSIGEEIDSWISDGQKHVISPIPAGKYVLVENSAADGYDVAEPITFEVKPTADGNEIVMINKKSTLADELVETSPAEDELPPIVQELSGLGDSRSLLAVLAISTMLVMIVVAVRIRSKR